MAIHHAVFSSFDGGDIVGRVDGAESRLKALAARLDALFGALAEPPPTPPWRIATEAEASPEPTIDPAEIERLQRQIANAVGRAMAAEEKLDLRDRELWQLRATNEDMQRALSRAKRELDELAQAHATVVERLALANERPDPDETSQVRAMQAEDSMRMMQEHLQHQMLELEELRRARATHRRTLDGLRDELRGAQQKRDAYKRQVEVAGDLEAKLQEMRAAVQERDETVAELERQLREAKRDLSVRQRREDHLRQALSARGRR